MRDLFIAFGFLTAIPVRVSAPQPNELGRAALWFPLVGAIIGALLVIAQWGLTRFLTPLLSGALIVAVWIAVTGGLHLDGLADCGDGLLVAASRERRLEIMRDPRLGTFGGMVLIMHLLIKTLAVASLTTPIALLLAPALARWLMLFVARQPAARPGGLGAAFSAGLPKVSGIGAAIVPLLLVVPGLPRSIFAASAAVLVMLGIVRLARSRLGGVTGDVLGMTIEVVEVVVLLGIAPQ